MRSSTDDVSGDVTEGMVDDPVIVLSLLSIRTLMALGVELLSP